MSEQNEARAENSYDAIPYPSHAIAASHPDYIYTMARLFRLDAKLPDESRVLELGCASGGNLIPLAEQMPNAKFVGVDLSAKQIAEGQATIQKLGLTNIQLHAKNFMEVDESFGQFDYIICHGVFSWVPPEAQRAILQISGERSTPQGVAYISYNAYPGWFMRGMIREMMLLHVRDFNDPKTKISQARGLLNFLVESTEGQEQPFAKFLKAESELLSKLSDSYLFHEHLEENNRPMFFYEFVKMARESGLQFLGEAMLATMWSGNIPGKAGETLSKLTSDVVQLSQYTDLVTNRMFRQSLMCHIDQTLDRHLTDKSFEPGYFSGVCQNDLPDKTEDLSSEREVSFTFPNGRSVRTNSPVIKGLLYVLTEAWPAAMTLPQISERIEKRLSQLLVVGERERQSVTTIALTQLSQMVLRGDIDFRLTPDRFVTQVGTHPKISPLAALQARENQLLTTRRHRATGLDAVSRLIVPLVDGQRSRDEIVSLVQKMVADGKINVSANREANYDIAAVLGPAVDKVLDYLRVNSLLV